MNWEIVELQDLAFSKKGSIVSGPFGSSISSKYFVEEGVPVIRGNNLTKGELKFVDDGYVYLTESKAAEFKNCIAIKDDIVFTAAGSIGQIGIIPKNTKFKKYIISNKQLRVRVDKKKVIPLFLYYWLSSKKMVKYLEGMNNGGAVPLLNLGIIKKVPIPLPPIEIQRKIADYISNYDKLIETNYLAIHLLEEAARLLYREWFVYFRFPGHEKDKIVDGIPEDWEKGCLRDIALVRKGKNITFEQAEDGDIPVVGGGLKPTYFNNQANVSAPVITISASGANAGFVNFYDTDIWASDCSYIDKKTTKFIYYLYLNLKYLQKNISGFQVGAAQPHVYPKDLNRLRIIKLPETICKKFEELVKPKFDLIKYLKVQNQKLAQARDLLLPRLMNGQIDLSKTKCKES